MKNVNDFFYEVPEQYENRSMITIGNLTVYLSKRFNWFNRFMIKLVFGFEVENIEKENAPKS